MKKLRRIIIMLTVIAILLPTVAACKKDTPPPAVTDSDVVSDSATETEPTIKYDDKGYQMDNLGTQDFGGKEIRILGWSDAAYKEFDFEYDEIGTTVLGQAIYNRNMKVEHRMGVNLSYTLIKGSNPYRTDYIKEAEAMITDRSVDAFACYSMCATPLMLRGYLDDLNSMEYLDFNAPWWSNGIVETASLYDRLYFATGSIAPTLLASSFAMFYNKSMAEVYLKDDNGNYDPNMLYDMVDNGTWTIDNFIKLSKNVSITGVSKTPEDTYGYVCIAASYDPWYFSAGLKTLENAADGSLQISDDWNSSKAIDLADKMLDFFASNSAGATYGDVNVAGSFLNGTALFRNDGLSMLPDLLQKYPVAEDGVGVLPMPKWEEGTDDKYVTVPGFAFTVYCVSRTSDRKDAVAATLECLASEGYRITEPELYDVLLKTQSTEGNTGSRDREMLDLIRNSVLIDAGRLHNDGIGGYGWKMFRNSLQEDLVNGRPNSTYSSYFDTNDDTVIGHLATINSTVYNIEEVYG